MKTSEAFKKAKQCLKPIGQAQYICHALAEAAYDRSIMDCAFNWQVIHTTRKAGFSTAIKVITDRIGSDKPVDSWLHKQGIPCWSYGPEQLVAYRHRWLDALIEEFEAKGD